MPSQGTFGPGFLRTEGVLGKGVEVVKECGLSAALVQDQQTKSAVYLYWSVCPDNFRAETTTSTPSGSVKAAGAFIWLALLWFLFPNC